MFNNVNILIFCYQGRVSSTQHTLGGVQDFPFENTILSYVLGDELDMYPQLEGGFGTMRAFYPLSL